MKILPDVDLPFGLATVFARRSFLKSPFTLGTKVTSFTDRLPRFVSCFTSTNLALSSIFQNPAFSRLPIYHLTVFCTSSTRDRYLICILTCLIQVQLLARELRCELALSSASFRSLSNQFNSLLGIVYLLGCLYLRPTGMAHGRR